MVGVGKRALTDAPRIVPAEFLAVYKKSHEFRDGDGRMGVVQLDGDKIGESVEGLALLAVAAKYIVQGGGNKEILLLEPEFFAGCGLIARVEDFGNGFAEYFSLDRSDIVSLIEVRQVEFPARSGRPQPHVGDVVVTIAGNEDVAGHGDDDFSANPPVAQFPAAIDVSFGPAEKADRLFYGKALDFPRIAATHPVVAMLALVPVFQDLMKYAVVIADAVSVSGQVAAGHGVEVT